MQTYAHVYTHTYIHKYIHTYIRTQWLVQVWVELTTLLAPEYFGEMAMLGRGIRHGAAIAASNIEVLVLTKLDFDLKIDAETRDLLNVLVSQYPKDQRLLGCATTLAVAPYFVTPCVAAQFPACVDHSSADTMV
jgi:hypothetical protein